MQSIYKTLVKIIEIKTVHKIYKKDKERKFAFELYKYIYHAKGDEVFCFYLFNIDDVITKKKKHFWEWHSQWETCD